MDDDTYSLTASILDYEYENGRRYHAYHAGKYPLPNDDMEQDRLDMMHHLYLLSYNGELYRAPLVQGRVRRALDIGCGTGIWAMDFADAHPEAEVTATDLSPIQPAFVPENLQFEINDVEDDWVFNTTFDYIHIRGMDAAIGDWPRLLQQAYENLSPGGWVEMLDFEAQWSTDDGSLPESSAYHQYKTLLATACESFGRPVNVALKYRELLNAAGFVNVTEDNRKIPLSPWHPDPRMKKIGRYMQLGMSESLEPYGLAVFTRTLNWDYNMVQALLAGVRQDLRNTSHHIYTIAHCCFAQKPLTEPEPAAAENPS